MRHQHCLKLNVGVEPDTLDQVGDELLIVVTLQATSKVVEGEVRLERRVEVSHHTAVRNCKRAIPHPVACPREQGSSANGKGSWTLALNGIGRDTSLKAVANAGEIGERVVEPSEDTRLRLWHHHLVGRAHAGRSI